jgi:hypothetical protein
MRFAVLFVFTLIGCSESGINSLGTRPYTVQKPTSKKNHAIFQIRSPQGGGCTAFVVSKTRAITAGHCVDISRSLINNKKSFKNELENKREFISALSQEIQSLKEVCDSPDYSPLTKFKCRQQVKDMEETLKSSQDFVKRLGLKRADTFVVLNSEGKELPLAPVAIDSELGDRDFAVLQGDFSDFEKLEIVENIDTVPGELLRSCGFAALKFPAACTNFIAEGNAGFSYSGNGYLAKGMSGGPVLDSRGRVVGINVAAGMQSVIMTPIIGVLDRVKE